MSGSSLIQSLEAAEGGSARQIIAVIAEIANIVGWQAGEAGADIAGGIVSWLAAHPDQIDTFLTHGGEMFIDRTIKPEEGLLTWRAANGEMMNRDLYKLRIQERRAQSEARV